MKRVIIVHGWDGKPNMHWQPWLKKELEKKKFKVTMPAMPQTDNPKIGAWVSHLAKTVKKVDSDTYFVGHSIGCQTIIRYLAKQKNKAGGVVFVAGWFTLKPSCIPEKKDQRIAKPWITTPINFTQFKKNSGPVFAIFSDDDPCVDEQENIPLFKKKLNAKTQVLHEKEHFTARGGVTQLPVVRNAILKMAR